jgi:hypothetical protein
MNKQFSISKNLLKLLLALSFLSIILIYLTPIYSSIQTYNQKVKERQEELREKANFPDGPIFYVDSWGREPTPLYYILFWFPLVSIPLTFYCLKKNNFKFFVFSIILVLSSFLRYILWAIGTKKDFALAETFSTQSLNSFEKIFYQITFLEIILLFTISILFILQIFILLRFVIERFQAKISLR